jgi:parallel beta helix pectate lyase-like protein
MIINHRLLVRVCGGVLLCAAPAMAATIPVSAGGSLQQAINAAQPGDTIALAPGATYAGGFVLPVKSGDAWITIRTAADAGVPDGGRMSPANADALAKIQQAGGGPAIATAPGAHHWRLSLLEIIGNGVFDIVTLGDASSAQRTLAQVPHDLVVDRVYVHGAPGGQKRGIALNSASTTITGCHISEIKAVGQDSQAVGGVNGPGPFIVTNNYLEAAGENVMFGGADPAIPGLVPADILIADNAIAKPLSWRGQNWVVKNLLELKNARRVSIVRNTFDYNWEAGQAGYAIVLTGRNQDGGCPWCQVDHVAFEQNIVRHSGAGVQILGFDNEHPSQQTTALLIRNNVFADIDTERWGGNGYFILMVGGPRDITVDHNTFISNHGYGIVVMGGPPILGFTFTNNLMRHNAYGFIGDDHGVGSDSIAAFLPGSIITRNVMAGGSASLYPGGNSFPSPTQFETQFVAYRGDDYHLIGASPWRGAGSDGLDLGALIDGASASGPRSDGIEGEGTISGGPVGGSTCPSLTFMVANYVVRVDPSTQFVNGGCVTLRLGSRIHGRGVVNADGSVTLSFLAIID